LSRWKRENLGGQSDLKIEIGKEFRTGFLMIAFRTYLVLLAEFGGKGNRISRD